MDAASVLEGCNGDSASCQESGWQTLEQPSPLGSECDNACLVPLGQCVAAACGSCVVDSTSDTCISCLSSEAVVSAEDSCLHNVLGCVLGVQCEAPGGYHNSVCDAANNNELCAYDGGDCCTCCKKPVVCETPKCLYVEVSTYLHIGEKSLNMMPCLINLYSPSYEAF